MLARQALEENFRGFFYLKMADLQLMPVRETLIKAFPAPDLRCEAAISLANPCASAGGSKETLN